MYDCRYYGDNDPYRRDEMAYKMQCANYWRQHGQEEAARQWEASAGVLATPLPPLGPPCGDLPDPIPHYGAMAAEGYEEEEEEEATGGDPFEDQATGKTFAHWSMAENRALMFEGGYGAGWVGIAWEAHGHRTWTTQNQKLMYALPTHTPTVRQNECWSHMNECAGSGKEGSRRAESPQGRFVRRAVPSMKPNTFK